MSECVKGKGTQGGGQSKQRSGQSVRAVACTLLTRLLAGSCGHSALLGNGGYLPCPLCWVRENTSAVHFVGGVGVHESFSW